MTTKTPGQILAAARAAAGLTLHQLGDKVGGLSPQYMHDMEKDRRPLLPKHWAAFARALPALDLRAYAVAVLSFGPVEIDASLLTEGQRAPLVEALIAQANAADPLPVRRAARGGR